ncbi:DUF3107 domain-containing protein [Bifidobacterium criceti]|uniref:ATP-binding protein n=1 Tax=Bifidobacterium criceti TaxID=1960969 RepID=A0A2A2EFM3_9BIFI|nr:DUF3107 domain-containing protein [Bifidobacterium criceti]PAU67801.1 ATP-binding protein [Bifidobacterium criceti]
MEIELGIQNVTRPVTFNSDEPAEQIQNTIDQALAQHAPIVLMDNKSRRFIVPADALGYAIIGSETRHAVGFGALS